MKKEIDAQTPAAGKPPEMNITRPAFWPVKAISTWTPNR